MQKLILYTFIHNALMLMCFVWPNQSYANSHIFDDYPKSCHFEKIQQAQISYNKLNPSNELNAELDEHKKLIRKKRKEKLNSLLKDTMISSLMSQQISLQKFTSFTPKLDIEYSKKSKPLQIARKNRERSCLQILSNAKTLKEKIKTKSYVALKEHERDDQLASIVASIVYLRKILPKYNLYLARIRSHKRDLKKFNLRCQVRSLVRAEKCRKREKQKQVALENLAQFEKSQDFSFLYFIMKNYPETFKNHTEILGVPIANVVQLNKLSKSIVKLLLNEKYIKIFHGLYRLKSTTPGFLKAKALAYLSLQQFPELRQTVLSNYEQQVREQYNRYDQIIEKVCTNYKGQESYPLYGFINLVEHSISNYVTSLTDESLKLKTSIELSHAHCDLLFKKAPLTAKKVVGEAGMYMIIGGLALNWTPLGPMLLGSKAAAYFYSALMSMTGSLIWKALKIDLMQDYKELYQFSKELVRLDLHTQKELIDIAKEYRRFSRMVAIDAMLIKVDLWGIKITRYVKGMTDGVRMTRGLLKDLEKELSLVKNGNLSRANYYLLKDYQDEVIGLYRKLKKVKDSDQISDVYARALDISAKIKSL